MLLVLASKGHRPEKMKTFSLDDDVVYKESEAEECRVSKNKTVNGVIYQCSGLLDLNPCCRSDLLDWFNLLTIPSGDKLNSLLPNRAAPLPLLSLALNARKNNLARARDHLGRFLVFLLVTQSAVFVSPAIKAGGMCSGRLVHSDKRSGAAGFGFMVIGRFMAPAHSKGPRLNRGPAGPESNMWDAGVKRSTVA